MKKRIAMVMIAIFLIDVLGVAMAAQAQALKPPLPDLTGIVKNKNWAIVLGKALFWDQQVGSDGQACASCHFHAGADTRTKNQLTPGFLDIMKGPDGDTKFGSERSDTGAIPAGHMPSGLPAGPNYTLRANDFPLHQITDESDRNSQVVTTTNDRVSSQGSFDAKFKRVGIIFDKDRCSRPDDDVFYAGRYAARQVEPRNTPSTINAAFFHRNFWDGRANNMFNGVGVFGMRDIKADPQKRLIIQNNSGKPELGYLELQNASLASQATAPPVSEKEMSCEGRGFADVGRKILLRRPLDTQKIHAYDSAFGKSGPFGDIRHLSGVGLKQSYRDLIMKAFESKYWSALGFFQITQDGQLKRSTVLKGYSQMEHNFSMFWGIAIMLYEATLISDSSEFDALVASGRLKFNPSFAPAGPGIGNCTSPTGDVDELLVRGCTIFARNAGAGAAGPAPQDGIRGGNCFICHNAPGGGVGRPVPPLLSQAALQQGEVFQPMIQVGKNLGGVHRHDQGFMSIGLRPVFTDLVNGGTDPYGNPLSFSRQYQNYLRNGTPVSDPYLQQFIDDGTIPPPINGALAPTLGADSAAKAPILRNVALTPPYFSWGGYASLRQVMQVYNRGGNRRDIVGANGEANHGTSCTSGDNSGTGPDGDQKYPLVGVSNCDSNTTATILPLGLSDCDAPNGTAPKTACTAKGHNVDNDDLAAVVRFMKSLTDYRVQCDKAPFDHPALRIINGHKPTDCNLDKRADDIVFQLPEVGASGYDACSGFCIPNAGDLFAAGMQARSGGMRAPAVSK